jgi:hypothetical protein
MMAQVHMSYVTWNDPTQQIMPSVTRVGGAPPGVEGTVRQPVDMVSGRFALVEQSREFTLVPLRPVLERRIGKPVSGLMRGDGISWPVGRGRATPQIE